MNKITTITNQQITYTPKNPHPQPQQALPENYCPLSYDKGKKIKRKTLTNHTHPQYWKYFEDSNYYYCPDPACPIIYFNNNIQAYFTQDQVKTKVMHKIPINTPYRIVCYCKGVLEETIITELVEKKCCETLKDIQEHTKANTGKDCTITNPTGRCCGSEIKRLIQWANNN